MSTVKEILSKYLRLEINIKQDGTTDFDKAKILDSIKLALSTHVSFNAEEINPETIQTCKKIVSGFKNPFQKLEFDMNIPHGYADNKQVCMLADLNNHIQDNTVNNSPLWTRIFSEKANLTDGYNKWSFKQILNANTRMNGIVDKINNHTVNGQPLSPYEKYLAAYSWITSFPYKIEEPNAEIFHSKNKKINKQLNGFYKKLFNKPSVEQTVSRDPMKILQDTKRDPLNPKETDSIVCGGYASILKRICDGINITCLEQYCEVVKENENKKSGHLSCLVHLKDSKYNIDGIFYSDPSSDSRSANRKTSKYCFHTVTYDRIKTLKNKKINGLDFQNALEGKELFEPEVEWERKLQAYIKSLEPETLQRLGQPNEIQLPVIQKALYNALTCDLGQTNNLNNIDRALYDSIITGMKTFGIGEGTEIDDKTKAEIILQIHENRKFNPIVQQQNKLSENIM